MGRVRIKTNAGGGDASEALLECEQKPCKSGMHFKDMYVEAENPIEFFEAEMTMKDKGGFYVVMFAMSDYDASVLRHEADEEDTDAKNHTNHSKRKLAKEKGDATEDEEEEEE